MSPTCYKILTIRTMLQLNTKYMGKNSYKKASPNLLSNPVNELEVHPILWLIYTLLFTSQSWVSQQLTTFSCKNTQGEVEKLIALSVSFFLYLPV